MPLIKLQFKWVARKLKQANDVNYENLKITYK